MDTHAEKSQKNRSSANEAAQKQNKGESTLSFVDNRTEASKQQSLQFLANNKIQQHKHTFQKVSVVQMMPTITGIDLSEIPDLAVKYIMVTYDLEEKQAKQILGRKKLLASTDSFDSIKAFVDHNLSEEEVGSYFEARKKSVASDKLGDETESITASIIGGKVNRGKGGRDVEWRLIEREKLNIIKKTMSITQSNATDQEVFENWKVVLRTIDDPDLNDIISTPIDAYSDDTLALAGGLSKFEKGTDELTDSAEFRVVQLIQVCDLLGYRPILVFNADVSCQKAQAVADKFGVHVVHLD